MCPGNFGKLNVKKKEEESTVKIDVMLPRESYREFTMRQCIAPEQFNITI